MTVIAIGVDETKKKTVTCPHCCSILQYVPNDVIQWDTIKVIRCPSCINGVTVS